MKILANHLAVLVLFLFILEPSFAATEVPTEVQLPGTQPEEIGNLESPSRCDNCHASYNDAGTAAAGNGEPQDEPWTGWAGAGMANAGRDPIFWATMAITEQDFDGAGDLCLRCHSTGGWYRGNSTPTDGSGLAAGDSDGVDCDACHLMTNTDNSEHPGVMNSPFIANCSYDPNVPDKSCESATDGFYGSGMLSLSGGSAKLGPYSDATARHQFMQSTFHRDVDFCGSCHDVSNSIVGDLAPGNGAQPGAPHVVSSRDSNGGLPNLSGPVEEKAAFNNPPFAYGIVERTFSEYKSSAFPTTLVSGFSVLPLDLQVAGGSPALTYQSALMAGTGGNYEDGAARYFSCQSCHMRPTNSAGAGMNDARIRPDLPSHDHTGGNYWLADMIKYQDSQGQLRLGGNLSVEQVSALELGQVRAVEHLQQAASLVVDSDILRVVNLTGHKLITGYPEGRRMWLNIKWYDASNELLREDGAYGPLLDDSGAPVMVENPAGGPDVQVESILQIHDSNMRIYEAKYAMTSEWAATLVATGKPPSLELSYDRFTGEADYTLGELAGQAAGSYHETFHFALNNYVAMDNRIPPYGMLYEEAKKRNVLPVPQDQYGTPSVGEAYDYWDQLDLDLIKPELAVSAEITLLYQGTSWEYIQFLEEANEGTNPAEGGNAFLGNEGENMLEAWINADIPVAMEVAGDRKMVPPVVMATTSWVDSSVAYTVGGTVSGLEGTGLVLRNNTTEDLGISANGVFTFSTPLADGSGYNVTVLTQPSAPQQTCSVTGGNGTLAGADVTDIAVTCTTDTFTVGGTVSGLEGTGLVLRNNTTEDLGISANGVFTFTTPLADGSGYNVTVLTQPSAPQQTCIVSGGNGTLAGADVTDIVVTCTTDTFTVGGTVSGLEGTGLVLRNNTTEDLGISANGVFTFSTPLADGSGYNVTVLTQPSAPQQTCSVTGGNGTLAGADVTDIVVTCSTDTFTVGGTVSGLEGTGLVLRNNTTEDLPITMNGDFVFNTPLADGSSYDVTVLTQPSAPQQTCSVTDGNGTLAGADVTDIVVTCTTDTFTVGGTVSGLEGTGLVLRNNTTEDLGISANGVFTFSTPLADGSGYNVTVLTQPSAPQQTCSVTGGNGTLAGADVTDIVVTCATDTFTVGGTVSGLEGTGLVLRNNTTEDLPITMNGDFVFNTPLADGSSYDVTVLTQPSAPQQTCIVSGGNGTLAGADVTDIVVTCATDTFTVGGTVSGLEGTGLVLRNNTTEDLGISANGVFTFSTPLADGSGYNVTVLTQPSAPQQTCSVTGGNGTLAGADVTDIVVTCATDTFTVGGTVSGLEGTGLVLRNNTTEDLPITMNGDFVFNTPLADGSSYDVTVLTQPSAPQQTCSVTDGNGTLAGADVTDIVVTCATDTFTVGGTVSGLEGTGLVLRNNTTEDLGISANGVFTFSTPLADGSGYNVTVLTQPSAPQQTCSVTGGNGTLAGADVTDIVVTCATDTFTVGGTVSGLEGTGLVLRNNTTEDLPITMNGDFVFNTPLADGSSYDVTVLTQPSAPQQTCIVTDGNGTLAGADVTDIVVTCSTDTFTVGGTVSGLEGTGLVLRNNTTEDLPITMNGDFVFNTPLADGSSYDVTVLTQPSAPQQTCIVTDGNGTLAGADVTDIAVTCVSEDILIFADGFEASN